MGKQLTFLRVLASEETALYICFTKVTNFLLVTNKTSNKMKQIEKRAEGAGYTCISVGDILSEPVVW